MASCATNPMHPLQIDLVKRGFYPKGGGVVRVQASSLPSGSTLPPINLTDRGLVSGSCSCMKRSWA